MKQAAFFCLLSLALFANAAAQMGNSPQMLFKHYRELVTPDAATAWFAIQP